MTYVEITSEMLACMWVAGGLSSLMLIGLVGLAYMERRSAKEDV